MAAGRGGHGGHGASTPPCLGTVSPLGQMWLDMAQVGPEGSEPEQAAQGRGAGRGPGHGPLSSGPASGLPGDSPGLTGGEAGDHFDQEHRQDARLKQQATDGLQVKHTGLGAAEDTRETCQAHAVGLCPPQPKCRGPGPGGGGGPSSLPSPHTRPGHKLSQFLPRGLGCLFMGTGAWAAHPTPGTGPSAPTGPGTPGFQEGLRKHSASTLTNWPGPGHRGTSPMPGQGCDKPVRQPLPGE